MSEDSRPHGMGQRNSGEVAVAETCVEYRKLSFYVRIKSCYYWCLNSLYLIFLLLFGLLFGAIIRHKPCLDSSGPYNLDYAE